MGINNPQKTHLNLCKKSKTRTLFFEVTSAQYNDINRVLANVNGMLRVTRICVERKLNRSLQLKGSIVT